MTSHQTPTHSPLPSLTLVETWAAHSSTSPAWRDNVSVSELEVQDTREGCLVKSKPHSRISQSVYLSPPVLHGFESDLNPLPVVVPCKWGLSIRVTQHTVRIKNPKPVLEMWSRVNVVDKCVDSHAALACVVENELHNYL